MTTTFAFAAPANAKLDTGTVDEVLGRLFPEGEDARLIVPEKGLAPVREWLAAEFGGPDACTLAKSPGKAILSAEGEARVLVVVPGSKSLLAEARAAREQGVRVLDLRTGRDLLLPGELAPLPRQIPGLAEIQNMDDEAIVSLGRQVSQGSQWIIAALSDEWVRRYEEGSLAEFADEIGMAYATVKKLRSTYAAWKDFPGFASLSYSVCGDLAALANRFDLMRQNPAMTVREARALSKAAPPSGKGRPRQPETRPVLQGSLSDPADDGSIGIEIDPADDEDLETAETRPSADVKIPPAQEHPAADERPEPAQIPPDEAQQPANAVVGRAAGDSEDGEPEAATNDPGAPETGVPPAPEYQALLEAIDRLHAAADQAVASGIDPRRAKSAATKVAQLVKQMLVS